MTSRKLWRFHGGVHPPFHKEESNQLASEFAGIPAQLVIPMQQHIGEAAEAVVKAGDKVYKGQKIAVADHHGISANIHAPTSGKISAIEERVLPHPSGLPGLCIVLDSDGKDDWGDCKLTPYSDYQNTEVSELLQRIRESGIVGLGGAAFPTAVKVSGSLNKAVSTLIINGAECEPYITCDDRLMRERSAEIIEGIKILQYMIDPQECLIGIEDNKPEAIEAMSKACETEENIEVVTIPTIYPSGGEKQLIKILTGKEVPAGGLPLDIGILGQNVATVYSIYQAVVKGIPLISRLLTVTGNGIQRPQNFEVLNGTPISYLAERAGGYTKMAEYLIMGGPMMGFALRDDHIPVVKASNCTLFVSSTVLNESNSAYPDQPTLPCIRCGKCMDACPLNLLPQQLYWHIRARDFERAESHNLKDCIECGACSYVCPSHIPLVNYYRFAKGEIREQTETQEKARRARQRHEFLEFRKAREKREREEKRAAHKAALQKKKQAAAKARAATNGAAGDASDSKADAIKAAMQRVKAKKQARAQQAKKQTKEQTKPTKDAPGINK